MLHERSDTPYPALVRKLASTGVFEWALEAELEEMNLVPTTQQAGKELHSKITGLNAAQTPPGLAITERKNEMARGLP